MQILCIKICEMHLIPDLDVNIIDAYNFLKEDRK